MRLLVINGLLLALLGLAVGGVQAIDRSGAAVEAGVRRYAQAVSNADLDAAMAEIAPDQRSRWSDFVRSQLGSVYEVRGIAVRSPSVLQRMFSQAPNGPSEVTVILDVNRAYPDEFYQPTTRVPVERFDDQWFLAAPLLATE
jgi:hypothetical protein